jgi:hypothetical protein
MRAYVAALLLPLVLLFAQQGELRHEYGHYAKAASSCQKAPADSDPCPVCLAYAHLSGAARPAVIAAQLLSCLAFHLAPAPAFADVDCEAALPRSRGPPSL